MAVKFIRIKWWFGFGAVTIYPFIFYVDKLDHYTRRHELIHIEQQKRWFKWYTLYIPGLLAWYFCYLALLPVGINPFRYKWEMDAFTRGSGYSEEMTKEILKKNYLLFWH